MDPPIHFKRLIFEISNHSNYINLNVLTKMQVEVCTYQRDDLVYLRQVWLHLYCGYPEPFG